MSEIKEIKEIKRELCEIVCKMLPETASEYWGFYPVLNKETKTVNFLLIANRKDYGICNYNKAFEDIINKLYYLSFNASQNWRDYSSDTYCNNTEKFIDAIGHIHKQSFEFWLKENLLELYCVYSLVVDLSEYSLFELSKVFPESTEKYLITNNLNNAYIDDMIYFDQSSYEQLCDSFWS